MIRKHWTVMLLLALTAAVASATVPQTSSAVGGPVALLAQPAPAGFSDGGDSMRRRARGRVGAPRPGGLLGRRRQRGRMTG